MNVYVDDSNWPLSYIFKMFKKKKITGVQRDISGILKWQSNQHNRNLLYSFLKRALRDSFSPTVIILSL